MNTETETETGASVLPIQASINAALAGQEQPGGVRPLKEAPPITIAMAAVKTALDGKRSTHKQATIECVPNPEPHPGARHECLILGPLVAPTSPQGVAALRDSQRWAAVAVGAEDAVAVSATQWQPGDHVGLELAALLLEREDRSGIVALSSGTLVAHPRIWKGVGTRYGHPGSPVQRKYILGGCSRWGAEEEADHIAVPFDLVGMPMGSCPAPIGLPPLIGLEVDSFAASEIVSDNDCCVPGTAQFLEAHKIDFRQHDPESCYECGQFPDEGGEDEDRGIEWIAPFTITAAMAADLEAEGLSGPIREAFNLTAPEALDEYGLEFWREWLEGGDRTLDESLAVDPGTTFEPDIEQLLHYAASEVAEAEDTHSAACTLVAVSSALTAYAAAHLAAGFLPAIPGTVLVKGSAVYNWSGEGSIRTEIGTVTLTPSKADDSDETHPTAVRLSLELDTVKRGDESFCRWAGGLSVGFHELFAIQPLMIPIQGHAADRGRRASEWTKEPGPNTAVRIPLRSVHPEFALAVKVNAASVQFGGWDR